MTHTIQFPLPLQPLNWQQVPDSRDLVSDHYAICADIRNFPTRHIWVCKFRGENIPFGEASNVEKAKLLIDSHREEMIKALLGPLSEDDRYNTEPFYCIEGEAA